MKVIKIFVVEWTTQAVEKEPEKLRLVRESNPKRRNFLSIELIKPTGEQQSWTESVKNFALSYTQETYPANLAPWWPVPPPLPDQSCLVGSKNVRATLEHCFFWGEGGVSWVYRALGGSILKLNIQRAFFLTFLSKIVFSRYWTVCATVNIWSEKKVFFHGNRIKITFFWMQKWMLISVWPALRVVNVPGQSEHTRLTLQWEQGVLVTVTEL